MQSRSQSRKSGQRADNALCGIERNRKRGRGGRGWWVWSRPLSESPGSFENRIALGPTAYQLRLWRHPASAGLKSLQFILKCRSWTAARERRRVVVVSGSRSGRKKKPSREKEVALISLSFVPPPSNPSAVTSRPSPTASLPGTCDQMPHSEQFFVLRTGSPQVVR